MNISVEYLYLHILQQAIFNTCPKIVGNTFFYHCLFRAFSAKHYIKKWDLYIIQNYAGTISSFGLTKNASFCIKNVYASSQVFRTIAMIYKIEKITAVHSKP